MVKLVMKIEFYVLFFFCKYIDVSHETLDDAIVMEQSKEPNLRVIPSFG